MSTPTSTPDLAQSLVDEHDSKDVVSRDLTSSGLPQNTGHIQPAARIVEAVVVGHEPKPPLWRRLVARAALGVVLGAVGLGAVVVGAIMTITVVGAVVGVPLVVVGLLLCLMAAFVPFSTRQMHFHVVRWPRSRP